MECENRTTTTTSTMGHPPGMLDRDQRTAKMRIFDRPVFVLRTPVAGATWSWRRGVSHRPHPRLPGRTSPRGPGRTGAGGSSWKRPHSVQLVILAIVWLTVLPSAISAPVGTTILMATRMDSREKWINPCDFPEDRGPDHDMSMEISSDKDMLSVITNQADIAYTRARHFAENYALKTFQMNLNELHDSRRTWSYDWLPSKDQVPKDLFNPVPREHLETLQLNEALLDAYEYLQRLAVGMEQMVWDEEDRNGEFKEEAAKNERNLSNVLCELQAMIYQKNIKMREDITRGIMAPEDRQPGTQTDINNRDWIIIRDYMNVLEYVREVFNHLSPK